MHPDCWAATGVCAIYGCGWADPDVGAPVATLDRTSRAGFWRGAAEIAVGAVWIGVLASADLTWLSGWGLFISILVIHAGALSIAEELWARRRLRVDVGVVRHVRRDGGIVEFCLQLAGGRRLTTRWAVLAPDVRPGDLFRAFGRRRIERIAFLRPRPIFC